MMYLQKGFILGMLMIVLSSVSAYGQEITKEQIKGQDEQVQDIKSDVLSISAELNQLEEKLLYPSNTEVTVFVSIANGEAFRLDSIELEMDGKPAARHIYSFKELEALKKGGVQRIYTGNVKTGDHDLMIAFMGKNPSGSEIKKAEHFNVNKDVAPKIVDLTLAAQGITLNGR